MDYVCSRKSFTWCQDGNLRDIFWEENTANVSHGKMVYNEQSFEFTELHFNQWTKQTLCSLVSKEKIKIKEIA